MLQWLESSPLNHQLGTSSQWVPMMFLPCYPLKLVHGNCSIIIVTYSRGLYHFFLPLTLPSLRNNPISILCLMTSLSISDFLPIQWLTQEFFLEYSQEADPKIWVSGLMFHIFKEHKDDLFALGQIEDTGTIFMSAVVPKLLKWSHVAWDGVQWKKALRDQCAMAFSCYVDIVNVKIWNMFVSSNWTQTQIDSKPGISFQSAESLYEAFSHMTWIRYKAWM